MLICPAVTLQYELNKNQELWACSGILKTRLRVSMLWSRAQKDNLAKLKRGHDIELEAKGSSLRT